MNKCKKIGRLLVAHAAGELSLSESECVAAHLGRCGSCRVEAAKINDLLGKAEELREEGLAIEDVIDWDEAAYGVVRSLSLGTSRVDESQARMRRKSMVLTFSFTVVFAVGVGIGYLLFNSRASGPPRTIERVIPSRSMVVVERTFARQSVLRYFKDIQLVFGDLMGRCGRGGDTVGAVDMDRIRGLLLRTNFLLTDVDDPQLLGTKPILEKIQWLLYDLLAQDSRLNCEQIQTLRSTFNDERLLLKIRLLEREIKSYEV